jgi:hypothetical protein
MIFMRTRRTLLALAVALAALAAQSATASAAPTGGNAPAAKACQKSGYQSLARAESPTVAFTSSDKCTAYAAKGGTLTPLQTVNLDAFREACEAAGGDVTSSFDEARGQYDFFCHHILFQGQEVTLAAACAEMHGIFGYFETTYLDDRGFEHFDHADAECRSVRVSA